MSFFFFLQGNGKSKYQTFSKGAQIQSPDSESSRNRQGFKYHSPDALAQNNITAGIVNQMITVKIKVVETAQREKIKSISR